MTGLCIMHCWECKYEKECELKDKYKQVRVEFIEAAISLDTLGVHVTAALKCENFSPI